MMDPVVLTLPEEDELKPAHFKQNMRIASQMVQKAIKEGHIVIEQVDGREITRKTCPLECTCLPRLPNDRRYQSVLASSATPKTSELRSPAPLAEKRTQTKETKKEPQIKEAKETKPIPKSNKEKETKPAQPQAKEVKETKPVPMIPTFMRPMTTPAQPAQPKEAKPAAPALKDRNAKPAPSKAVFP